MGFLILLLATAFALPTEPACWRGALKDGATIEVVLTGDKSVADALWLIRGKTRILADISCAGSRPLNCTLSDDGGKFELRSAKRGLGQIKFEGELKIDNENPDEARIEIRPGPDTKRVNAVLLPDDICKDKVKELHKIFGVGP